MLKRTGTKRHILRASGAVGLLLFATLFLWTFHVPRWVEDIGARFIASEVSQTLNTAIAAAPIELPNERLKQLAQVMLKRESAQLQALREQVRQIADAMVDRTIRSTRDGSCECRERFEQNVLATLEFVVSRQEAWVSQLEAFIQSRYLMVATQLSRDIRVFALSNALVFALVLVAGFAQSRQVDLVFPAAMLLVASTVMCAFCYLFEQNWLLTIIFNDYLGMGYTVWLGVVFLWFCDVFFNRARVTGKLVEMVGNAIASVPVVPC